MTKFILGNVCIKSLDTYTHKRMLQIVSVRESVVGLSNIRNKGIYSIERGGDQVFIKHLKTSFAVSPSDFEQLH